MSEQLFSDELQALRNQAAKFAEKSTSLSNMLEALVRSLQKIPGAAGRAVSGQTELRFEDRSLIFRTGPKGGAFRPLEQCNVKEKALGASLLPELLADISQGLEQRTSEVEDALQVFAKYSAIGKKAEGRGAK